MVDAKPVELEDGLHDTISESTTLVTFLLSDLRKANRIELFGSWDNFSIAYPMSRDSRRGRGYWRGIHTFKNIICDGDLSVSTASAQRDGALRVGGLYWYYYRLDGDVEYFNPAEPSTNNCPLLPGQTVNVLEVPLELPIQPPLKTPPAELTAAMTWNPEDRWVPLKRKRQPCSVGSGPQPIKKSPFTKIRKLHTSAAKIPGLKSGKTTSSRTASTIVEAVIPTRPESCPIIVPINNITEKAPKPRRSLAGSRPQSSENTPSATVSRAGRAGSSKAADPVNPFHKSYKRPTAVHYVPEFLRATRPLRSRACTAQEFNSTRPATTDASGALSAKSKQRPSSAPSAFASVEPAADYPELSDSDKLKNRMRSLRLRIACAKLRKLQYEQASADPIATSWILDSLPDTFSGILGNFGGSQQPGGNRNKENRESANFDELSASPPQLSFSSRQSTLWTPETASVFGASEDGFGPSLRMSIRHSREFQLALHNIDDTDDTDDPASASAPPEHAQKAADRLGLRFSGIGLDSQETIKPPKQCKSPRNPLDEVWSPAGESAGAAHGEQAAEQHSDSASLPMPELTSGLNTNELMDNLDFLAKAIA